MKKKLLLVCLALLSLLGATAQTPPVNSTTNGSDVWYYIKNNPRSSNVTARWLTGGVEGVALTNTAFSTSDDARLWKVVTNPSGGFALQNKQFGTYLGADVVYNANLTLSVIPSVTAMPVTGLMVWSYVDQVAVPGGFYLVNSTATTPITNAANATTTFNFYSAGGGTNYRPMNYGTNAPGGSSAVVFMTAKEALKEVIAVVVSKNSPVNAVLTNAIAAAQSVYDTAGLTDVDYSVAAAKLNAVYNLYFALSTGNTLKTNSKAGVDPGQYPAAVLTSLQTTLSSAQTIYDNAVSNTTSQLEATATSVNSGISTAKAAIIVPVISTSGNERWYFLQGTRPTNSYMTSPAQGVYTQIKDLPVIPDDSQLWKFVANTNGTANGFVLQNKLTGAYLDTDAASGAILPVEIMPTNNLRFIASNEYTADKTTRFWIENAVGSTPSLRYHAGASNSNWGLINWTGNSADNSTWLIIDYNSGLKTIVAEQLIKAKTLLANATEGTLPGQFTTASIEVLQGSIDFGQGVLDDVNASSDDCVLAVKDLNGIVDRFKSDVISPTVSTDGAEVWYHIQSPKDPNLYLRSNGVSPSWMYCNVLALNDDRFMWKFIQNTNGTADGYALQNKATLEFLNADVVGTASSPTVAAMPINNIIPVVSDASTNGIFRFWIKSSPAATNPFLLHTGDGNSMWNYSGASLTDGTWLFIPSDDIYKSDYLTKRTRARAIYTASVEGPEFGQYTAVARATYDAAIAQEETKDVTAMTLADITASETAMNDAKTAFICNREVSTLASVTKKKWFRLVNAQYPIGYATNKAMTSNGRAVDTKFTYETINLTSDAQLFRFDMNADGSKATTIINKATGLYLGSDGMVVSTPTVDNEFEVIPLDGQSFGIKPTTKDPIHAAQGGANIVNWKDGANSASAWKFEYVSSEDIDNFLPSYLSKRTQTRAKYDAALLVTGDQIGQYQTAPIAALSAVITAEEAKDAATLTQAQLLQGILDMNAAAATAALTVNTDVKLLVSATPNTVKWFRLINGAATSVAYASGMAMSSNGKMVKEPFTFEAKDVNSNAQLFKFVLNGDQTKVATIYNKGIDLFLSPTGTMITKDSIATVTNEFEIVQLVGGRTFWIHPTYMDATDPADIYRVSPLHAAETGSVIVNYNDGAGSASAWMFEFVMEEATAVKNVEAFNYRVRTTNHIITVDGVDKYEVYSILGQKQNIKNTLSSGVYFVKINNAIKKVVVE